MLGTADVLTIINNMLLLFGGVAAFIIGMNMMGNGLEKAAGKPIRRLMGRATNNRVLGVLTGAAVTAVVTSSSATTVMIVGFVNVGLMTLAQAASVIMGANIGTTITAFISALSTTGGQLEVTSIFAFCAFVGALMNMISKKDSVKSVGTILEGLGLIFVGLSLMSSSMSELLAEYVVVDGEVVENEIAKAVKSMFTAIGYGKERLTWEIVVLFLIGAALTALVQSSAAVTAIVISLASSGLISMEMAMFIILGTNVGTCMTAMLSSIGTNLNARRTAVFHLMFNIIGSLIFIIILAFTAQYIAAFLDRMGAISWEIAIFHMSFNILTTLILLPFTNLLVRFVCFLMPEKKNKEEGDKRVIDPRLIRTPPIAVGQSRKMLSLLYQDAYENYERALGMLLSGDTTERQLFRDSYEKVKKSIDETTNFLVQLSMSELTESDENKVSSFYHVLSDIERVCDYSKNIADFAEQMDEEDIKFSESAARDIRNMDDLLKAQYGYSEKAFGGIDISFLANIEVTDKQIDVMGDEMKQSHLQRTADSECTPEAGAIFLQITMSMERIGGHMMNIGTSIRMYAATSAPIIAQ